MVGPAGTPYLFCTEISTVVEKAGLGTMQGKERSCVLEPTNGITACDVGTRTETLARSAPFDSRPRRSLKFGVCPSVRRRREARRATELTR